MRKLDLDWYILKNTWERFISGLIHTQEYRVESGLIYIWSTIGVRHFLHEKWLTVVLVNFTKYSNCIGKHGSLRDCTRYFPSPLFFYPFLPLYFSILFFSFIFLSFSSPLFFYHFLLLYFLSQFFYINFSFCSALLGSFQI